MHPNRFLRIVQEEAGLKDMDEAKLATQIVFDLLHHRITPDEAKDVKAQLPHELANIWEGGEVWYQRIFSRFERQNRFNKKEFMDQINARKQDIAASPERVARAVFYALQSQISAGEARDVRAQLPHDLELLWDEARPLPEYAGGGGGESEVLPPFR